MCILLSSSPMRHKAPEVARLGHAGLTPGKCTLQFVLGGGALVLAAIFVLTSFADLGGPSQPRPAITQQVIQTGHFS